MESWICNFYLTVAARKIVLADPSLRYTRMLLGRSETNQQPPLLLSAIVAQPSSCAVLLLASTDVVQFSVLVSIVAAQSCSSAASASWLKRPPEVRFPLAPGFFRGQVIPVTEKLARQWLPCQAPGVIGSALGLVGPVSVYCDWVRWRV